ncbi:protein CUSTOS isoform X2 [Chaetodon trifascialis]|uniref:protein CUSTOS isoform X2 n=1 Tax=Chaetodon trifascialis TaxID=109706 RepID=UPI0039912044
MAARAGATVKVDEDSSSSDDEALRRCQEAVWETRSEEKKHGDTGVPQSKRIVVAAHEHDGNELQVTEGFRTHVAKKLGSLLDSCITEIQTEASSCVESAQCDDDEGFLLFSTSVPGQSADDRPAPVRRRPAPSSSDSDSEMETRLKEAAVSIKDLLPSLSPSTPSAEPRCSEDIEKEEEESAVRKKKKRKQSRGEGDCAASLKAQSNGEHRSSEQEDVHVKKKKKKKKKRRDGNAEEEALN